MNKRLIVILILIFIVLFSFGCKKQPEVTETPKEELPKVVRPGSNFVVNNYPNGKFPIEDFLIQSCGSIECDYTMRNFTWAKVEKIDGRELELNLFNEVINVDVGGDVTYKIFIQKYDPADKTSKGIIPTSATGDHFNEIKADDLIGMLYELDQGNKIIPKQIMIIKLEVG